MKNNLKKFNLIGLSLLGTFLIACFVNVTSGEINISTSQAGSEHIVRLHSLFLRNNEVGDSVSMKVNTGDTFLTVQGGLAIGKDHSVRNTAEFSAIGGGENNTIDGSNNGIVGGKGNHMNGKNSLIGGGESNTVQAENSVVGGGSGNRIYAHNSVIAGGAENYIDGQNSVILGGQNNKANGENSLVFGQYSEGNTGSFVFGIGKQNSHVIGKENSARIDAVSGVLIGTYTGIAGVNLVIGGALSLTGTHDMEGGIGGEIIVKDGCIRAYDGENWQVMGKSSRQSAICGGEIQACQFGETLLYQGDTVDAYKNYYSNNCSSIRVMGVMCSGGNLVEKNTGLTGTYYPYCYNIND